MNCKNCEQIADGNFCTHCGQKTSVERINLANFLKELSSSVFQINKGLFYTLKELFVRPGHSIRDYLSGKRKYHFKPIAYAFTLSTIYFLLSHRLEGQTYLDDALEGFLDYNAEIGTNQLAATQWLVKNYAYTILIFLPLYALASFIAFGGTGYNYLEHFILNAYITGQQAIFYAVSSILALITHNHDFWISVVLPISIGYAFYVFWQFFSKQSRLAIIFRSILVYVLFFLLLIPVLVIFLGLVQELA